MLRVPEISRSREAIPFKPTLSDSETHEPGTDDFCVNCGADLRIVRKRVTDENDVPQEAKNLLAVAEAAELALLDGALPEDRLLADVSLQQKRELAAIYSEGLEASIVSSMCGLNDTDLAGIGADGTFFYVPNNKVNVETLLVLA